VRRELDRSQWGRKPRGRLKRALGLGETWHDRHPLPEGWRPRTRIDCYGREVEPWSFMILDAHGYPHDGGEWWLPVGYDPDQVAYEVLTFWLDHTAPEYLEPHELPGLRCCVRHAAHSGQYMGVAFAQEQALSA
jgi:hypothetical protein